jgi:hypothetical protein
MEPLDLTRQPPRSCFEELDGLMLMPRTIDKLRGQLPGGNPGDYFINGKTPGISQYVLDRLGISLDDLRAIVASAADENEIAAWLRKQTDTSQYDAINATLRRIKPKHAHDPEYFAELYAHTLASHPELEHILEIIEEDDRRMFGTAS